jgi:hypothetical protein
METRTVSLTLTLRLNAAIAAAGGPSSVSIGAGITGDRWMVRGDIGSATLSVSVLTH